VRAAPLTSDRIRQLGWVLVAGAAVALFAGTVVTGTGPHGGDEDVRRLDFSITDVARVHGAAVIVFLALVLTTIWLLGREQAPPSVRRDAYVLLSVISIQAVIGYVQYFAGVPVALVALHVTGAVAVWVATLRFTLGLRGIPG
jgi:cytochrome c oxidase assembly protein subunit 15